MSRSLVLALAVAILAIEPALAGHAQLTFESGEDGRADLANRGQHNCVAEASLPDPGPACPAGPSGGVLVLDSLAMVLLPAPSHTPQDPPAGQPQAWATGSAHNLAGDSPSRGATATPDVIPPGPVTFRAWHGRWWDNNTDGVVDARYAVASDGKVEFRPGNEWRLQPMNSDGVMQGYLSPGSHPPLASAYRTGSHDPDFQYWVSTNDPRQMWNQGTNGHALQTVVFLDGSLVESFVLETVTHPILVPGFSTGGFEKPYTTTEKSLVDIDRYSALAPGPVVSIYQETGFAATVRSLDSPGFSTCPEGCLLPPVLPAPVGPFPGTAFARARQETELGSGSSAESRHDAYLERYRGWIDLLPGLAVPEPQSPAYRQAPLPALGPSGAAAVPPGGLLAFEIWTGVWRDGDGNGFVGVGAGDPYEGGARPVPDRYYESGGEFIPANGQRLPGGATYLSVTIEPVPGATWGPAGVLVLDRASGGATALANFGLCGGPVKLPSCGPTSGPRVEGASPITILTEIRAGEIGHRQSASMVLFPEGSQGAFKLCTAAWGVATADGLDVLHDCDTVEAMS